MDFHWGMEYAWCRHFLDRDHGRLMFSKQKQHQEKYEQISFTSNGSYSVFKNTYVRTGWHKIRCFARACCCIKPSIVNTLFSLGWIRLAFEKARTIVRISQARSISFSLAVDIFTSGQTSSEHNCKSSSNQSSWWRSKRENAFYFNVFHCQIKNQQ